MRQLFILSLAFVLAACTEQDIDAKNSTGSIAPSITWVSSDQYSEFAAGVPAAVLVGPGTTLPADLVTVRLVVTGTGITNPISADFPASTRSGTISGIPVGSGRTVTLQGLNISNEVIYEGIQINVLVVSGSTTQVSITAIELLNLPPIADAGIDQTVASGALVTHAGIGRDTDGGILSYSWVQLSGETVMFLDGSNNTDTLSFMAPIVSVDQVLTFQLTVVDEGDLSATDDVNITVAPIPISPPTADAGADQTVNSGVTVTLSGSGSDDGIITGYNWSQVSGSSTVLINNNTAQIANFDAPTVNIESSFTFRLTVTDNDGATATDDIMVTVLPSMPELVRVDFQGVFEFVTDIEGNAPAAQFDLVSGYLIFDSTTPDTNSTSIPQGDSTDEFGEFIGAITDIFITFNGLEFRLDDASPNLIETVSYAGSSINFHLEATAKIKSNGTVLDFLFSTNGDGFRGVTIPDPTDSLPSAGDNAGSSSFLTLTSSADNYILLSSTGVAGKFYDAPIPVVWLLGSGLIGLIGVARRKKV